MVTSNDLPPKDKRKLRHIKGWKLGAALVGASFLPCPECGLPLAIHAWPFLLLFAVRQLMKKEEVNPSSSQRDEREAGIPQEVKKISQNKVGK